MRGYVHMYMGNERQRGRDETVRGSKLVNAMLLLYLQAMCLYEALQPVKEVCTVL